jgi:regulatory protein
LFATDLEQRADIEQAAVRILSQCEHTARLLRNKLLKKGFDIEDVDAVLADLSNKNLLSDARFAEQYVISRINKGFGPQRIAQEMREKGVAEQLLEATLEDYGEQWPAIMAKALQKKFGSAPVLNFNERAKRARFLEYRGFSSALIRQQLFNDQ